MRSFKGCRRGSGDAKPGRLNGEESTAFGAKW
jgi:hypothetical protein